MTRRRARAVLAIRLGLKKAELKAASEEQLTAVLGVPAGSVTPIAVCRPTADRVLLLIDRGLQARPFLVHPMRNTMSIRITHTQLSEYLGYASLQACDAHSLSMIGYAPEADHGRMPGNTGRRASTSEPCVSLV